MSTQSQIPQETSVRKPMPRKPMTVPAFRARKGGLPLVCLTAYTAHVAHLVDEVADMILVGDSVGMVIHGMENTLGVTMNHMIMHAQAVRRGVKNALIVVDMPFGSFEASPEQAFRNAARLIKKTGCMAVKLEGGGAMAQTIAYLTGRGIPVMAHIGLMPQQTNAMGGYKVVRDTADFAQVIADAKALEEAGAFAVLIEGVVPDLARQVTAAVSIPTIGIGASADCDGQILVFEDMIGLFPVVPNFVKRYGNMEDMIRGALTNYADEVRAGDFPSEAQLYK